MKKPLLSVLAVTCIAVTSQMISCTPTITYQPVRSDEPGPHMYYDSTRYRLNEMIVIFKKPPTTKGVDQMKEAIGKQGINPDLIKMRKCNSCNAYVELWQAPDLETAVHSEGLVGGTGSRRGSQGVGEDSLAYYSLNFRQDVEMDSSAHFRDFNYSAYVPVKSDTAGKDVIRIAVLDTGIDADRIISTDYLWTNQRELSAGIKGREIDNDNNCYIDDTFGWNFVDGTNDVKDLHRNLHGTLVSHYIINQFARSEHNAVKIMTLKTHDKEGKGYLFASICAIHYAIEKKANIINASWGFYYYDDRPHPYLNKLITEDLRSEGILFVTAAGNRIEAVDDRARIIYQDAHGVLIPDSLLRNLEYHNFYPACLSNDANNVVTVTTADTTRVSPTQNYSPMYVDMGAIPDEITPNFMKFNVPFPGPITTISGSSFATAIMTGRIGALLPMSSYLSGIDKGVLNQVEAPPGAAPFTKSSFLKKWRIRNGRITPRN